ncbi:hypothetical protein BT63DRAFT_414990 [Microthyrium microscopicum]|uniref:Uncharacterized protein n=1 Tax=Microthyrium microscopicum TaxID=703497 RepID=A0A6A6U560_9PEZI|nr:hypothetical protein BT63DRAFT_414990 [Microthyrium microscopicum]
MSTIWYCCKCTNENGNVKNTPLCPSCGHQADSCCHYETLKGGGFGGGGSWSASTPILKFEVARSRIAQAEAEVETTKIVQPESEVETPEKWPADRSEKENWKIVEAVLSRAMDARKMKIRRSEDGKHQVRDGALQFLSPQASAIAHTFLSLVQESRWRNIRARRDSDPTMHDNTSTYSWHGEPVESRVEAEPLPERRNILKPYGREHTHLWNDIVRTQFVKTQDLPELSRLERTLHKVLTCRPVRVSIATNHSLNWVEQVKCFVQRSINDEIDWWPLQQPAQQLKWNEAQLSWTCQCGTKSTAKTHIDIAALLYLYFKSNPEAPNDAREASPSTAPQQGTDIDSTAVSPYTFSQTPASTSSSSQHSLSGSRSNPQTSPQVIPLQPIPLPNPLYVFLLVRAGDTLPMAQIEVSRKSSVEFFHDLKVEYLRLKGLFRRLFSLWQYSHCDFSSVSTDLQR